MSLIDKIKAARVVTVKVDHMTFTGRRPTYEEFGIMFHEGATATNIARKFISGWSGVRERDLLPGGSDDEMSFDADLWAEAVSDMPKVWKPIRDALENAVIDSVRVAEETEKNSVAGSK